MTLQKIQQVFVTDPEWSDAFTKWFTEPAKEEKPVRYVEFKVDPLAYVVKWIESNTSLYEIHSWLEVEDYNAKETVTEEHLKKAEEIRNFFKNSIMFRRLKDEFISPFMQAVEELNENTNKVNVDHLKILIKLPDFYRESTETRDLFAKHVSLNNLKIAEVDDVWTFVKKIKRQSKQEHFWRYYFVNSNKNLLYMTFKPRTDAAAFLDYIISQGPVGIRGTGFVTRQPGHDFYFYKITDYELYPVVKTTS